MKRGLGGRREEEVTRTICKRQWGGQPARVSLVFRQGIIFELEKLSKNVFTGRVRN